VRDFHNDNRRQNESTWDVLVRGKIQSNLDTQTLRQMVTSRSMETDDMVRKDGGEWRRISEYPELTYMLRDRVTETRKQLSSEYPYWKPIAVAVPISFICALPAPLYVPLLETGAQYWALYVEALIYYLIFCIGMACFMNYNHHRLIQKGNKWGYWRYSKGSFVGLVTGFIMVFTFCPPMFPLFLPIVNQIITAQLQILFIVFFFKIIFEDKVQFED